MLSYYELKYICQIYFFIYNKKYELKIILMILKKIYFIE